MAEWLFRRLADDEIEQEVTQLGQFASDELSLQAALIRESHQNSLDARQSGTAPVRTKISFAEPRAEHASYYKKLFGGLVDHLGPSGINVRAVDFARPHSLVIEDFGTTGLTGDWSKRTKGTPFYGFWRANGASPKSGQNNGRWGLGKLVFSGSSQIRSVFGLTVPSDDLDKRPLLMGQAVLKNHAVGNIQFAPHAIYGRTEGESSLQLPILTVKEIKDFCNAFGISRQLDEPGLTIVVPFINEEFSNDVLVGEVLKNYFFPILTGELEVDVSGELISQNTFYEVARKYFGKPQFPDEPLIEFIRQLQSQRALPPMLELREGWQKSTSLAIPDGAASELRHRLAEGSLVHVRAPIVLSHHTKGSLKGTFDLFLKKAPDGQKGQAIYVRNSLTLPEESRKFTGKGVLAALIASEGPVAAFLGDAENPAHTKWSSTEEKVKANWEKPRALLPPIRNSLDLLYRLLFKAVEQTHEDALIDYFAVPDPAGIASKGKAKPKKSTPPVIPKLERKPKLYRIDSRRGGFSIKSGQVATEEWSSFEIRVLVAYDLIKGNPFKKFDRRDFDLSKQSADITANGVDLVRSGPNEFRVIALSPDFRVDVGGFDPNRDLVVDARKVGP